MDKMNNKDWKKFQEEQEEECKKEDYIDMETEK